MNEPAIASPVGSGTITESLKCENNSNDWDLRKWCERFPPEYEDSLKPREEPASPSNKFDFIITNPPYGKKVSDRDLLNQFDTYTSHRRSDIEALYIESCLKALKPGGIGAVLMPNGWLANPGYQKCRIWFLDRVQLIASIQFSNVTFYPLTTITTSVLVFRRLYPGEDPGNYSIFMAINKDSFQDSRGRPTDNCDLPKILAEFLLPHVLEKVLETMEES